MPTIFFIFGITGDLARSKLLPALYRLYNGGLLPKKFHIVGFGRRNWNKTQFEEFIKDLKLGSKKEMQKFLTFLTYHEGNFDSRGDYLSALSVVRKIDDSFGQCSNKLFYLAVPPVFYKTILINLHASKISEACGGKLGWSRILIEKPFGHNLDTARSLNLLLGKLFKEDQIYRIDHYLAKETLQNIVAFRMDNPVFEEIWNKDYIDNVEIKFYEEKNVSQRGAFYDEVGALRDVGQNHMLQMLSLIAMARPKKNDAATLHALRGNIVDSLVPISDKKLHQHVARGQYVGYLKESGVDKKSKTETYFKIKALLSLPQWKGVPFYLESGKALHTSEVLMKVHFKGETKNFMTFHVQPKVSIELHLKGKNIKFKFKNNGRSDAYEKILLDCISGDRTLFASTKEVESAWKFIMPIIKKWHKLPLHTYPQKKIPSHSL